MESDPRMDLATLERLLDRIGIALSDDAPALRMSAEVTPDRYGLVELAVRSSATVRDAVELLVSRSRKIHPALTFLSTRRPRRRARASASKGIRAESGDTSTSC